MVLDLECPEKMVEDFKEWKGFIEEAVKMTLEDVDVSRKLKIVQNFKKT